MDGNLKLGYYWVIRNEKQQKQMVARLGGGGWLYEEGQQAVKMIGGAGRPYKVIEYIKTPQEREAEPDITPEMVQEAYDMGRHDGVNALTAVLSRDLGVPFEEVDLDYVDDVKPDV
jgi:hypothetical protein